jgi:drug/metabolite transporter (DMT)-like permease
MNIFLSLLSPFLYAFSNILDENMGEKMSGHPITLVFYSSLVTLFFALCMLPFFPISIPDAKYFWYFLVLGMLNTVYLIPYYEALLLSDTSIVVSLFSLEKLFSIILAIIILGETLSPIQIFGFLLVVVSCFLLTFDFKKRRSGKVLYLMSLSSFIISFESIIAKLAFANVSWYDLVFWTAIFISFTSVCYLLIPRVRKDIFRQKNNLKKIYKTLFLTNIFTNAGQLCFYAALFGMPVFLFKTIDSIQPIFVVLIAIILETFFKQKEHENIHLKNLEWKLFIFLVIILGIYLVVKDNF